MYVDIVISNHFNFNNFFFYSMVLAANVRGGIAGLQFMGYNADDREASETC